MREIIIEENNSNQRFDKYLLRYLNTATKSFVYKMLRKKNIELNNSKATGNEILKKGDNVKLFLSEETIKKFQEEFEIVEPANKNLDIVFEDENILVINKAVGVLSHPEKNSDTNTLIDKIIYYLYNKGEFDTSKESTFTPAIANRLDRNTSGIVICGKNLKSLQELNEMFKNNTIDKIYTALVLGVINEPGILEGHHYKNFKTNEVEISNRETKNTKPVITEYTPVENFTEYTLVEVKLVTGKTHQIRAHFQSIKHPVVGDRKYGDQETNTYFKSKHHIDKQLLHAEKIVFNNKNENDLLFYLSGEEIIAPLPRVFKRIIDSLK